MENTTRQSNNKAFITGILKEKNLTFKTNAEGKEVATGYLMLITNTPSGKGEVKVSVSQNKLTKEVANALPSSLNIGKTILLAGITWEIGFEVGKEKGRV